jgi:hypothetical protein
MTIAGKISMGGSIAISLATAGLAWWVMTTKTNRYMEQLRAVESSLTGGKFTALGLPYTGNFAENEAEPATTVAKAGVSWAATSDDLKDTKGTLDKTKVELTESKAKTQELSLNAEKLTKDLSSTKIELEATNSKLKVTSEQLRVYNEELKGSKPSELFARIKDLTETKDALAREQSNFLEAKKKLEDSLKKAADQISMLTKSKDDKKISLSGKIVAVNPTWNFVILDLGKNDQMVEGLTMVIYRGEKLVGKIKTVTVDAQTSVADVLPGTPATAIEVGDQVIY